MTSGLAKRQRPFSKDYEYECFNGDMLPEQLTWKGSKGVEYEQRRKDAVCGGFLQVRASHYSIRTNQRSPLIDVMLAVKGRQVSKL
jgi:hypothetical protein